MAHILSTQNPPTPVSKQDQRREAILAVARDVFNELGYEAASMSLIAARLGGSKGTLYNYFPSKEALFEAHIRAQCAQFAAGLFDFAEDCPVADVLTRFGKSYVAQLMTDRAIRTFQIVMAEAERSPELARVFHEAGPAVGVDRLQGYLERCKALGKIDPSDCALAAGQFLALCRGHRHLGIMLNVARHPTPEAIAEEVAAAVDMFMARYGAGAAGAPAP